MARKYDAAIIGGGVVGSAELYMLSRHTSVGSLVLLEKYQQLAPLNSNSKMNSQTLHFGDIETNIKLEKAKKVKEGAEMVVNYLAGVPERSSIASVYPKMVIGVGDAEPRVLEDRFSRFKTLYPHLRYIERDDIGAIEPKVVAGRDPSEEITALYSKDGYAVDYGRLSTSLIERAQAQDGKKVDVILGTEVGEIERSADRYKIKTNRGEIESRSVLVSSGAHSLSFAHSLGYGKEFGTLPVAGNFYFSKRQVANGKIYTVQNDKLPFAAIHADPDVNVEGKTRFGPTAKILPVLERGRVETLPEFVETLGFDRDVAIALGKMFIDKDITRFITKNMGYDIPIFGKASFANAARKIIPTLRNRDLEFATGYGGIRPQVIDKKKREFLMGEAKIVGDNIIFNMTPSPGATICLKNAENDARKIVEMLGAELYEDQLSTELKGLTPIQRRR